jgi:hypothetical protein
MGMAIYDFAPISSAIVSIMVNSAGVDEPHFPARHVGFIHSPGMITKWIPANAWAIYLESSSVYVISSF